MEPTTIRNAILIPGAILLGGLVIAIGVYVVRVSHHPAAQLGSPTAVRPVSVSDHTIGNPTAPIQIIEYSDIDCAYCKQFQETMSQVMVEYGSGGKVAWTYRHFPIAEAHPNAAKNAVAAECAASLGGTNAFWKFIDAMHQVAPENNQFDPNNYKNIIPQFGIDSKSFNECLNSPAPAKKVEDDYQNGLAAGATGAPYTVLIVEGSAPKTITGSVSYASMKKFLDDAIQNLPAR